MPNHLPPAPPHVGPRSPEGRETVEMAEEEARRTELAGASEKQVPDRTLKTTVDQRESMQHEPILPIVEEQGENGREDSDIRPETPPKDKMLPPSRAPPPTPPKTISLLKPDSADSGYAGNGGPRLRTKMSKESLNKSLPPLPQDEETGDSAVKMQA
jgi:1-phosphatidylinositol-4-phosphate 5-kinase